MESAPVGQWWDKLDPETRAWFLGNPGAVVLPRSVINTLHQVPGNGEGPAQLEVSAKDHGFMKQLAVPRRRGRGTGSA